MLWIDDELDAEDVLVRMLACEGLRADVAQSGRTAIAQAQENHYDVILLDVRLSDMFGLTVLDRLLAAHPKTPVVMITGYYFESELEAEALRRGAASFIYKPILEVEVLISILRSAIRLTGTAGPDSERMPATTTY